MLANEVALGLTGPSTRRIMPLRILRVRAIHTRLVLNRHGVYWNALGCVALNEFHEILRVGWKVTGQKLAANHVARGLHPARRAPGQSDEKQARIFLPRQLEDRQDIGPVLFDGKQLQSYVGLA